MDEEVFSGLQMGSSCSSSRFDVQWAVAIVPGEDMGNIP